MADNSYPQSAVDFPQSKEELMSEIKREWDALMQVVNCLTPDQMTTPDSGGWSPRDNLAHLSAWMNIMLKSYLGGMPAHQAMGIDEQKLKELDEDGENAVIFERNRGRSTEEVLSELKDTYNETVKTLRAMDFQNLLKAFKGDNPQTLAIDRVRGNTSEHFKEHRVIIGRALSARKS